MAEDLCQHGCYPVDKRWHGGSLKVSPDEISKFTDVGSTEQLKERLGEEFYDGNGAFVVEHFLDFKRFVDEFGPEAGEQLIRACTPAGEPYVRGRKSGEDEPIKEQITKRAVSISGIGQGQDMGAYLDIADRLGTHYDYETVKVGDWIRATPQSQVHQELSQRRQQAEQQINRTLGSLSDLYEQKQLLEHDKRKLEERAAHFRTADAEEDDTQDELKADFVDLVDQHTGRASILQLQANNIFPSITADFYSMTALDDLEDGHLKNLPQNEKAVLRKKWKLFTQWKHQFREAVQSKLADVNRRLNSVQTSIEETEKWLSPYVQDIKQITQDFPQQLALGSQALTPYLPAGMANTYRAMKVIGTKDQSPVDRTDKWYDVMIMEPINFATGGFENPQAAGQGLVVFSNTWIELLCCKHVKELVFEAQQTATVEEVQEYISRYIGEPSETLEEVKNGIRADLDLSDTEAEKLDEADTIPEAEELEKTFMAKRKPSSIQRRWTNMKEWFGFTDDFFHPHPHELRRGLIGPHFPSRYYLDYKYENGLYVMK